MEDHLPASESYTRSPTTDGRRLASGSYDHTVKVWDAATGQETPTLKRHTRKSPAWPSARTASGSPAAAMTEP